MAESVKIRGYSNIPKHIISSRERRDRRCWLHPWGGSAEPIRSRVSTCINNCWTCHSSSTKPILIVSQQFWYISASIPYLRWKQGVKKYKNHVDDFQHVRYVTYVRHRLSLIQGGGGGRDWQGEVGSVSGVSPSHSHECSQGAVWHHDNTCLLSWPESYQGGLG